VSDRALLIGINNYRSPDVPPLRGCEPDVADVQRLLTGTLAFPAASIVTLLGPAATSEAIRAGLRRLADGAQPGDRLVLHYSGHGTQYPDDDGDEADRLDECLVPYDLDWGLPRTVVRDDEFARWIETVAAGVHMTIIFDCCHSGTGTRELVPPGLTRDIAGRRGVLADLQATARRARAAGSHLAPERQPWTSPYFVQARFVPPPAALEARSRALAPPRRAARAAVAARAFIDSGYRGAFSYHFCRLIRDLTPKFPRGVPRGQLQDALLRAMRAGRFSQEPQIEAAGRGRALGPLP
jgi:hypothetical protein